MENVNWGVKEKDNGEPFIEVTPKRNCALYLPPKFSTFLKTSQPRVSTTAMEEDTEEDFILKYLPSDIVENLDEDAMKTVHEANAAIAKTTGKNVSTETATDSAVPANNDTEDKVDDDKKPEVSDADFEAGIIALIALNEEKWRYTSLEEFKNILSNPESIHSDLIVNELKLLIQIIAPDMSTSKLKPELVNNVSDLYGTGRKLIVIQTAKSLKSIITDTISKWPKAATNVAYATNIFSERLDEWKKDQYFMDETSIYTDDGSHFKIPVWYAQPSMSQGKPIAHFIDPHHLKVNNRCRVCAHGMLGMGIKKEAWHKVAEESAVNNIGLTVEHVVELRDRQKGSFADLTFSEKVENEMRNNGDLNEAEWAKLMRNFDRAVDEAGLTTSQRIQWLMDMRIFLLSNYNPMLFPPPGYHMRGMPMAQFEGLLTNIDRRFQLYHILKNETYNHRSISSLDCETFFGCFQV